jgi:hypothetical protein
MIGTILALAGAVASGVQAINQNQKKKQAEASAMALTKQAKEMKMQNAFKGLQVADQGERLAMEYGAAADQSALEAMKASPEGAVGGVAAVQNQADQRNLQIGAALSDKEMQRDQMVAQGQQQADYVNFQTQQNILENQITGAQTAAADATAARNAAITGAIQGVAGAITPIGDNENLDNKAKTAQAKSRNAGQVGAKGSFAGTTVPNDPNLGQTMSYKPNGNTDPLGWAVLTGGTDTRWANSGSSDNRWSNPL